MVGEQVCQGCGTRLSADDVGSLCPKCLPGAALASSASEAPTIQSTSQPAGDTRSIIAAEGGATAQPPSDLGNRSADVGTSDITKLRFGKYQARQSASDSVHRERRSRRPA